VGDWRSLIEATLGSGGFGARGDEGERHPVVAQTLLSQMFAIRSPGVRAESSRFQMAASDRLAVQPNPRTCRRAMSRNIVASG
jgi:hypothetical protein